MAEWLALPTSDHGVAGSNPAGGEILPEPKRRFIAQSLSCSPFHRLEMTEILLKGRKTLTHPSILTQPVFWILVIKSNLMEVSGQPRGGTPALNVMAIRDQHLTNVSKQRTLLVDVDVAPSQGTA